MLVEHHIKYKEIHGADKTILISESEHKKLHNRLRRGGECKIPDKIVKAAHHRTEKTKKRSKDYHKQNFYEFHFTETMAKFVALYEQILYNKRTGNVCTISGFCGTNGKKLLDISQYSMPARGL